MTGTALMTSAMTSATRGRPDPGLEGLHAMIRDIGVAMLTTRAHDGRYVSRPVATLPAPFDGSLWFFCSASSHKAAEIRAHPQVNLAYASPERNRYVSVSGLARVRRDRRRIEALWSETQRVWFPGGPDDRDLTLIRVRVETAEYWDGPASITGKVLRFVAAAVAGNADLLGENRTLRVEDRGRRSRVVHGNTRGDAGRAQSRTGRKTARKPGGPGS
jgi:general stress protein 26